MKKPLNIPAFKNEDEEFEFWSSLDVDAHFEPSDFIPVSFPNLKPTTRPLSLRLPTYMIARIKEKANALGMPYQALIKSKLGELL